MINKQLTWRELIVLILSSGADLNDTASIADPVSGDEVLVPKSVHVVDYNHPLYGVLDKGHLVIHCNR